MHDWINENEKREFAKAWNSATKRIRGSRKTATAVKVTESAPEEPIYTGYCKECGKKIEGKRAKKFCSPKCNKANYYKLTMKMNIRRCEVCGSPLAKGKKKYCSADCKKSNNQKILPKNTIEAIAKVARNAGMSYGQYVREYGI